MTNPNSPQAQPSQTNYLQVIAEVSQTINSILDLDQLLTRVSELIRTKFNIPYVHIFLKQYVPHTLEYRAGSGDRAKTYHDHQIAFNLDASQGLITLTARTGKVQLSNDVSTDPRPLPNPITGVKEGSELALPLIFGGRILGVLDLQSERLNAFSEQEIAVFETLSANVAIAVRNASLYRSEIWRTKNSEKFRQTAELLSQSISQQDFFSASLENILELLPGEVGSIWLFPPQSFGAEAPAANHLFLSALRTPERDWVPNFQTELSPGEAWFYLEDEPEGAIFRKPGDPEDPLQQALNLPSNFSGIATAITISGQIVGVLVLHEGTPGRYGPESEMICATFAGYLGSAIEKNRLDQETQAQTYYTSVMLQVAMATRNLSDANNLLRTSGEFILSLIGGASVALILKDSDTNSFQLQAALGEGTATCNIDEPCTVANTLLLEQTLQSGKPTAMPASDCSEDIARNLLLSPQDTILLFPLIAHERQIGLLMHTSKEAYIPLEPELILGAQRFALLEGIAQQTAVSLQNIALIQAKQAEAVISNILLQITNLFVASKDLQETLGEITRILLESTNAEEVALIRFDPEDDRASLRYLATKQGSYTYDFENFISFSQLKPALAGIEQSGHLILPGNLLAKSGYANSKSDFGRKDVSSLCFPMAVPGEVHGLLVAVEVDRPGRTQRVDLLNAASLQIASGIQNYIMQTVQHKQTLIDRELQLARQIQKTFLPEKLPLLRGYDLAAEWQTARQVGGDFYDVFELSPGKFGLVIADVSDKGLPAALYMTVSRTLIRARALEMETPARTLEKVNHILQLDSSDGFFVTVFYAIVDLDSGKVTYCMAGHNPPWWLRSQHGIVQSLNKGGIALGMMDPILLQDQELVLASGDGLVLYTDGITETFSPEGEAFGDVRFKARLESLLGETARGIIEGITQTLDSFRAGRALDDDYTLLVIRRE
jgi:sigma-B regulation protein RsbU (phosphoserine phosphatase)